MDCTFKTEMGNFNFRVAAIIKDGSRVLLARNPQEEREFYFSVGGRVKFGESTEEAVLREIKEETGVDCEIDRLACVHENFFTDDNGVPFHEISVFYFLKPNKELFNIASGHKTSGGPTHEEYLIWIDLENSDGLTIYPDFYRTVDLDNLSSGHFISREIKENK